MGLKEKRLMKVIEDENMPFHKNSYNEMTGGGELQLDIDWDEWANDYEGLLNLNGYQIQQFTDAVRRLTGDDMGKEALREQVKTIKIVRVEDPAEKSIELGDGVLTIRTAPSKEWDGVVNASAIGDYLTDNL